MKTIGFHGGNALQPVGTVHEVYSFFACLAIFWARMGPPERVALIGERLFKRYLVYEDLSSAREAMAIIRSEYGRISASAIDWSGMGVVDGGRLDISRGSLAEVYAEFFEKFEHCATSATLFHENLKGCPNYRFVPVSVVVTDLPEFFVYKSRPLSELDSLAGDPFWYS